MRDGAAPNKSEIATAAQKAAVTFICAPCGL
jgi:hypothetical protein